MASPQEARDKAYEDCNTKAAVGGLNACATAEMSFEERRASLLRRFDWAEGELLRQIMRLRDAKEALQYANHSTVRAMEILLSLDTDLRKY
jgi:hypothetical protein